METNNTPITINNAGLVLLNNYINMLFERLKLVSDNKFKSLASQEKGVMCLYYLSTGQDRAEDIYLPLNKLLCGLPLTHQMSQGIKISDDDKTLMNGLIEAAISHWQAIGTTSINGFRGNWIIRDGLINNDVNSLNLIVEKRSYDILLNTAPFSFGLIKLPWMTELLKVDWGF